MQATLSLASTNTNANTDQIEFQGKFEPSRDDLDCVAIFNAETQTFRLELLTGGQATLRHMPGSKRDKAAGNVPVDKGVKIRKKETYTAHGNAASLPGVTPEASKLRIKPSAAAAAAAAVKVSQDKEDIADDFFHGALD